LQAVDTSGVYGKLTDPSLNKSGLPISTSPAHVEGVGGYRTEALRHVFAASVAPLD
jgi:hypothetical protein